MNEGTEINKLLELSVFSMSDKELEKTFYKLASALILNPESKHMLKTIFQDTLAVWGRILESQGCYTKLFTSYEKALQIFNNHEGILTNLGAHLLRAGYMENASIYFKQALKINKHYIPALRNLESVFNSWIERWHYRMLNDRIRNSSFREAIIKKVKQGFTSVLDIGTGTSILSLFAVEAGAQEIYACDASKPMIDVAESVLEYNDVCGKIKLLNKYSHDIEIPSDIPHRVSLVITETVDVGLVGENILQTLIHAWDNLLLPSALDDNDPIPSSKKTTGYVIPHSALVWVAAVECSRIDLKYRFNNTCPRHEDISYSESLSYTDFFNLNLFALDDHEYDSIDLEKVPEGFRFLTTPGLGLKVNFNDRNSMVELFNGTSDNQPLELFCCADGHLDAFIVWFDLILDENIELSSAPMDDILNRAKCWDQAVFPLQMPKTVLKNEKLKLTVHCTGGKMSVKYHCNLNETILEKSRSDNANGCALSLNYEVNQQRQDFNAEQSYRVSLDIISYLNDKDWTSAVNETVQTLIAQEQTVNSLKILDISPFPMLGMAFLLFEQRSTRTHNCSLTCIAREENDKMMLMSLAYLNGIHESQLHILNDFEEVLALNKKFDYVVFHPVDASGKLNEKCITNLPLLSQLTTPSGHIFPKKITICCLLIHSSWLQEVSEVLHDRTCGFHIASHINKYKVSEHQDVLLSTLQHKCYTEVIETPCLDLELLMRSLKEPLVFEIITDLRDTGLINAIPYWFKIKLCDNYEVTSFSDTSFSNQSTMLLETPIHVNSGEKIRVNIMCHQGLIHATVCKV